MDKQRRLTLKEGVTMIVKYEDGYVTVNPYTTSVCVGTHYTSDVYCTYNVYSCGHIMEDGDQREEYQNNWYLDTKGNCSLYCSQYEAVDYNMFRLEQFPKHIRKELLASTMQEHPKYVNKNCRCQGCRNAVRHLNDYVIHGLSAYNHCYNLNDIWKRCKSIKASDYELCCTSSIYPGPIGIAGHGDIVSYFDNDCWSYIDNHSKRCIGKLNNVSDHNEYWVRNIKPDKFWVKEWFWEKLSHEDKSFIIFMAKSIWNLSEIDIIPDKYNK